ncbi:MAG: NUDIX domain-containing protein [Planctomycetota bacterium]
MTDDAYRIVPAGGPRVRTDIVDVYVFRARSGAGEDADIDLLQLHRASDPLGATWQPIMGHIESGETAVTTAVRELAEEVGLTPTGDAFRGMWALEQVHPFYLAALDCIVMSPRFAVEVAPGWEPTLDHEHDDARWITWPLHAGMPASDFFMWPGQRAAIAELTTAIARRGSIARDHLRIDLGSL